MRISFLTKIIARFPKNSYTTHSPNNGMKETWKLFVKTIAGEKMTKLRRIITGSLIMIISLTTASENKKLIYPETRKTDVKEIFYGTEVTDPYRWLEDDMSAETEAWVQAQNELTFSYLNDLPGRDAIRRRLTDLWNYARTGTPFYKAGRWFIYKNDGLQDQSVLYMMDDPDRDPVVLLDPNTLSNDGTVALT